MAEKNSDEKKKNKLDQLKKLPKKQKLITAIGGDLLIIVFIIIISLGGSHCGSSFEDESYYILDEQKFEALPEDNKKTYVILKVSLAYPFRDVETEQEIILKRIIINSYIQETISEMTYSQLNTADKREKMKKKLLKGINRMMDHKLRNLYFSKPPLVIQIQ